MQEWYKEKLKEDGRKQYIGKIYYNKHNESATVIDYNKITDVTIQYDNGYIEHKDLKVLKEGMFKSPYSKTVCGVGYIGKGNYECSIKVNGKNVVTEEYNHWQHMIKRCYSENYLRKMPTYQDCSVCDEWLCFQNFAQWYNENKWSEISTFLDKDILVKGNRVYSPETCVLVDNDINLLFIKSQKVRGELPIGVIWQKNNHNYVARCSVYGKGMKHIGVFNNPTDAFYAYKNFKESHIKQIADEYKSKYPNFPQKLYDAMYNYQVEITD